MGAAGTERPVVQRPELTPAPHSREAAGGARASGGLAKRVADDPPGGADRRDQRIHGGQNLPRRGPEPAAQFRASRSCRTVREGAPGQLLHLDVKRLGRFDRVGHRITRKRSFGSPRQGFEFVYVATDDASRLSYAEIHADERSEAARTFLTHAVSWFAKQNITVERVMTDNGSAFVGRLFAHACRAAGITHKRIRPYTPRTNGKVERFIQTLLREWAYRFAYASSQERKRWLAPYLHFYNYHRAHSALGYNPPISRLARNNVLTRNS